MDILDKHYGSNETTEAIYRRHKEIRDEMVKTELELKAGAAEKCQTSCWLRAITWV